MLLHVTHETRYDYTPPVETAQHLAHLKPCATPWQRLLSHIHQLIAGADDSQARGPRNGERGRADGGGARTAATSWPTPATSRL